MANTGSWNNGGTSNPVTRTNMWGNQSYTLAGNEVFGSLFNLLIHAYMLSNTAKGYTTLVNKFRKDGSLYGDTITYKKSDVLKTEPFGDPYAYNANGNFQGNLLKTAKPADPKVQYVQIDNARFIEISLDNFLTKRAFDTEGSFSEFHNSLLDWLGRTKRVYESSLINVFCGTTTSSAAKGTINIDITTAVGNATGEEANKLEAQSIAQGIADIIVDMKDNTRDYTDWGTLDSFDESDLIFVWNSKYYNKIDKLALPVIFNKDGLVDKFNDELLTPRFFGRALTESDFGSGKVIGTDGAYDSTKGTIRAARELTYNDVHYFAGDALATTGTYVGVVGGLEAADVYLETSDVICKIIHKDAVPFMSAYESEESFYNSRSKVTNFYLHFLYSTPCYLKGLPFITVKAI